MSLLMVGCSNKVEEEKNNYLAMKSNLEEINSFDTYDELPCDITISLKRLSEDVIMYEAILDNPREDMNKIKMMVIHNGYTDSVFPSIGVMDDSSYKLMVSSEEVVSLSGYIESNKDIRELSLELKVWIAYEDNDGNLKNVYYKSTI